MLNLALEFCRLQIKGKQLQCELQTTLTTYIFTADNTSSPAEGAVRM